MRVFLISILLLFATVDNFAQTLDDYLQLAYDSNAALKARFYDYQAALEQVPQVGALPDPEVSFGYFVSPIETRVGPQEAIISAYQMFPWFGTLGARKDIKLERAKAKYELFKQARNDLFFRVKDSYYELNELEQTIRITKENLIILRTFESIATTKFETGKAGLVDVLRIQMEIAELENNLLLLEDQRTPISTLFNQQLNRDGVSTIVLPDSLYVNELLLDKASLSDSILTRNNQLESLKHRQLATEYSVQAARKSGSPSFGIGLNYMVVSERTDVMVANNGKDGFMPMVTFKIPLYRGKYNAQVKEAALNLDALESMENEFRNTLKSDFESAWNEYTDAGRKIQLFHNQIITAEKTRQILIEAYGTDGSDFEEILRVQRILLRYELEIIKSEREKNTAVARIEKLY